MPRLDHITLGVRSWKASRDWWRDKMGFEVEFEIPNARTAAVRDEHDLTVLLQEGTVAVSPELAFTIQVNDVETAHQSLTDAGVVFTHPPKRVFWGYGAECLDPNGYRLRLWDEASMKAKGGS